MGDSEPEEWADLKVVDKGVGKVRASYASVQFKLSAKPPEEWVEKFIEAVDADPATADLGRNPGPVTDDDAIVWELNEDDVVPGWEIVKTALAAANESYGRLHEARARRDAELQERLDARDKKRDEINKKVKTLK